MLLKITEIKGTSREHILKILKKGNNRTTELQWNINSFFCNIANYRGNRLIKEEI